MFTTNDLINFQQLIKRGNYQGLEEAEVAVYLDRKIKAVLKAKQEEVNGDSSKSD
jgi:hypothetical protein